MTSQIDRLTATLRANRERAEAILAKGPRAPILPDVMTPEHPIAKLIGFEAANALVDTPARRRADRAKALRDDVARLSRAGRLVREIVAETGASYNYVVQLRASLGLGRIR